MTLPGRIEEAGPDLMYVAERGEGPPLILLHGFLVSHYTFRDVVAPLSASHRVLAVDLPGHGESESPRDYDYTFEAFSDSLIGLMDHLGIESAAICGHSMGGGVGLFTAAKYPDRVDQLVVVDTSIYPIEIPFTAQLSLLPVVGELFFFQFAGRGALHQYLSQVFYDPSFFSDAYVEYYWDRLCRPGRKLATHRTLRAVCEPAELLAVPRQVRCPTLVVWGEDDRILPAYMARRLGEEIGDVRVELLERCGHSPAEERPDDFVRLVDQFLANGR